MPSFEIEIGDKIYEIDAPNERALRQAVNQLRIEKQGEEIARRRAPAPAPAGEQPANTPRSILAAAHLGGAQPTGEARREFETGEAMGALSVPAVAGLAAAPAVVGAGTVTGLVANEATDRSLRAAGVPGPVAETVANVVGTATGGVGGGVAGAVRKKGAKVVMDFLTGQAKKKAAAEAAKKAAQAGAKEAAKKTAEKSAKKAAAQEAAKIADKIRTLKNTHKLSDAQVVSSLRELYGLSAKDARMMLKIVIGGG